MTFPPPTAVPVQELRLRFNVASRSTKVRIIATAGAEPHAKGATLHPQADGSITVVPSRSGGHDVILVCPEHSDVCVGTASGKVELSGSLGHVSVVTATGRIDIEQAADLDVRTASAAVHVGLCDGGCRIATTSGRVHIARAGSAEVSAVTGKIVIDDTAQAVVSTVHGSVSLGGSRDGRARVRTVSGSVDISLPTDTNPATKLRSMTGKIRCDPTAGTDGEVDVKTISGSIRVSTR